MRREAVRPALAFVGLVVFGEAAHRFFSWTGWTAAHHVFHLLYGGGAVLGFMWFAVRDVRQNGMPRFSLRLAPQARVEDDDRAFPSISIRRVIEVTDWAVDILSKAEAAAKRLNPSACIRLVRARDGVDFELTDEPQETDAVVERAGFTLYVESDLRGIVDVVEPHDRLILRPPGDPERSVREQS